MQINWNDRRLLWSAVGILTALILSAVMVALFQFPNITANVRDFFSTNIQSLASLFGRNQESLTATPSGASTSTENLSTLAKIATSAVQTPARGSAALTAGQEESSVYPLTGVDSSASALQATSTDTPNGLPDLAVFIREIGTLDRSKNSFTATSTVHYGERAAIAFTVQNNGTAASGTWSFNAVLPTYPVHTFNSDIQQSLLPLERIEFTLGFDQIDTGGDKVATIAVNTAKTVRESDYENNSASTTFAYAP